MRKLILFLLVIPIMVIAQNHDQNYVKSVTYKEATTNTIPNPEPTQAAIQVQYFDGLGRPIQTVAHKQSTSNKDIIIFTEYDGFGRQVKEYLPYVRTDVSLDFDPLAQDNTRNFYATNTVTQTGNPNMEITTNPYSEKVLELSPLARVFEQAAPGEAWEKSSGKTIKFKYHTNVEDEVVFYEAYTNGVVSNGLYPPFLEKNGYYPQNQLYKTITKDENWTSGLNNTTEEFKNKQGQVILKRTYSDGQKHDTYYVYDIYGNLTFVLPPLVDNSIAINESTLNGLCYQYKYDNRNRLVEKKLPGKQWEYIVYDKLDRPIATGPTFSPFGENTTGWMITKYDPFGRVAYTAWKEQSSFSTQERHTLQELINNSSLPQYESKLMQPITVNSVSLPYTNNLQPANGIILTINYYDDYAFTAAPSPIPTQMNGVDVLQNVKGMPTGNWTRVLTSPNESLAETSFMYYDKRGRVLYTKQNNHLGGATETFSELDFLGIPLRTFTIHQRDSNPLVVTIEDEFEYLPNGKLRKHIQKVNDNPKELIVANTYDELGQLISKQVGGQDVQNEIGYQKIDYRYNIRGWLTHINNIEDLRENGALNHDLFAFKINYNEVTESDNGDINVVQSTFGNTVKPLFNGNIAETYWKTGTDDILRKYSYSYDDLNRLRKAYFQKPYDVVSHTQSFDEYIDYDKNGNIDRLQRFADQNEYGNVIEIDALGYHYQQHSNKLMKVTDATNFSAGFGDDSDGTNDTDDDYAYDDNGNMISDQNKGIGTIKYNHLNLPTSIRFVNGEIRYLYTAAGVKVGKKVIQGGNDPVVTDYLGGFQYVKNELQFFPHPEGYVSVVKFGPDNLVINYAYQYKDHLGNIRLNYGKDPETNVLKVLEENHYYPFGLKHQNYNTGRKQYGKKEDEITTLQFPGLVLPTDEKPMVYKYKFQGQERQDELGLNWDSFKYRNYDYAIGRFLSIDPLADIYVYNSTYAFAENKLGLGIELEGLEIIPTYGMEYANARTSQDFERIQHMKNMQAAGTTAGIAAWVAPAVVSAYGVRSSATFVVNEIKDEVLSRVTNGASDVVDISKMAWKGFKNLAEFGTKKLFGKGDDIISSGKWINSGESMSDAAASFQKQITGVDATQSFKLNGVKFDGLTEGGTLLEAKSGMANFVGKDGNFHKWFKGTDGLLDQANRQLKAADGAKIEWHFENKNVMQATQNLFKKNGIEGIELKYTPRK